VLIGVNTWVWTSPLTDADIPQLAAKARSMGFDLLELPLETLDGYDYDRARRALETEGLACSATLVFPPDRDLIHPDAGPRSAAAEYIAGAIDAAAALGASTLSGPLFASVGRAWRQTADERERDLDRLVTALGPLAARAADVGVRLGLEPLNRFETSFVNIAEQAVEIVDRVGSPGLGILLDTFHMNIEEESIGDAIRAAGPRLSHLHACENHRGAPGAGHVPWTEVADALRAIDFRGPVVIESFTGEVAGIAKAAAVWRPVAASQDELASAGGSFLRELLA
jgi:D-psicose/D-tagatose/L-ribulose 3-epimerase